MEIRPEYGQELRQYLNIYGREIDDYMRVLKRQAARVTYLKLSDGKYAKKDFQLEVVESGTRITMSQVGDAYYLIKLVIGYGDIMLLHQGSDLDPLECLQKIASHELLHFAMGHLDKSHVNAHKYAVGKGSGAMDLGTDRYAINDNLGRRRNGLIMDTLFVPTTPVETDNKWNRVISNIADDFVVNKLINMKAPALRAGDYGLPEGLEEHHYYSIIFNLLNSYAPHEVNVKDFVSEGVQNHISQFFMAQREPIRELFEHLMSGESGMMNSNVICGLDCIDLAGQFKFEANGDELERMREDHSLGTMQGNIPAYAMRMQTAKTGIWKSFNDLLKDLKKDTSQYKLSLVDKVDNWHRYNNRKDVQFVLQGKSEVYGSLERKISNKAVLMVDVSTSMQSIIDPLFTFCYFALERCELELVFYDTEVQAVFDRANKLELKPFLCGGTNLMNAFDQYGSTHKGVQRLYVLSDCEDYTIPILKAQMGDRMHVWRISHGNIDRFC